MFKLLFLGIPTSQRREARNDEEIDTDTRRCYIRFIGLERRTNGPCLWRNKYCIPLCGNTTLGRFVQTMGKLLNILCLQLKNRILFVIVCLKMLFVRFCHSFKLKSRVKRDTQMLIRSQQMYIKFFLKNSCIEGCEKLFSS